MTVFAPGEVVDGKYRVLRILGEGGMGVVALAEHLLLGEFVALKALNPIAAQHPDTVARFHREGRTAVRIQSEHVARVMDVGDLGNGLPFLVMEYLEGNDLAEELDRRGPLPIAEAVDCVLEAAIGVAAAHACGIVHRDLKPSNLFRARLPNGRRVIKVLDFGIAKELLRAEGLTSTLATFGSAPYMSPEQIRAARSVDVRADVWSLGVVLFELLTRKLPFAGESVVAMAAAIVGDPCAIPSVVRADIPEGLSATIMRCLEKDRDLRFSSLAELTAALAPFGTARGCAFAERVAEVLAAPDSVRPPAYAAGHTKAHLSTLPAQPRGSGTRGTWTQVTPSPSVPRTRMRPLFWGAAIAFVAGAAAWTLIEHEKTAGGEPVVGQREPAPAQAGSRSLAAPEPESPGTKDDDLGAKTDRDTKEGRDAASPPPSASHRRPDAPHPPPPKPAPRTPARSSPKAAAPRSPGHAVAQAAPSSTPAPRPRSTGTALIKDL